MEFPSGLEMMKMSEQIVDESGLVQEFEKNEMKYLNEPDEMTESEAHKRWSKWN